MTRARAPTASANSVWASAGISTMSAMGAEGLELASPALFDGLAVHLPRKPNSDLFLRHAARDLPQGSGRAEIHHPAVLLPYRLPPAP